MTVKPCSTDHDALETPFCPLCGAASSDALATLLHYLRERAREGAEVIEQLRACGASDTAIERHQRAVSRWSLWAEAVQDALARR